MMLESKAWKPSKDALQKGHTGSGTDRNFFCVCHSQQRTRAGAYSTSAPALTSSFSNRPCYFCNPLRLVFFWFFSFSGFAELMNSLVPP